MIWTSYTKGLIAEYLAAFLLLGKGYIPQERRYKTPYGEIDLIVKRRKTVVFVEVKRRATLRDGLEAITTTQRKRIENASQIYLGSCGFRFDKVRFDVVIATPNRLYHLKDAWRVQT
jgi:putative endonuclease